MNALPRRRARSSQEKAKSTSCSTSKVACCEGVRTADKRVDLLAREDRGPFDRPQLPSTRIRGAESPASSRSEPFWSHRICSHGAMASVSMLFTDRFFLQKDEAEEPGPKAGLFGLYLRCCLLD